MIDTSSARAGLALVSAGWEVLAEKVLEAGRDLDLAQEVADLVEPARLAAVAVALGPGSFTGLRVGVAYGLGLAMGRGIPLLGLDTLAVCRARSPVPSRGVSEAGRGRVYYAAESEAPALGEPEQVPRQLPLAGWLRPTTAAALGQAGHRLLEEAELRSFGSAAAFLAARAAELEYGSVRLRYMQSYGAGV